MSEYKLTRRQAREAALIFFYGYLVAEKNPEFDVATYIKKSLPNLDIILKEKFNTYKDVSIIDNELFIEILKDINNIDKYKTIIEDKMENWTWDRINVVEQAILLLSLIQLKNEVPKKIVINEAIELAKEYCPDENYKYINGILDKL